MVADPSWCSSSKKISWRCHKELRCVLFKCRKLGEYPFVTAMVHCRIVLLHDAIHCFPRHCLERVLEGVELLPAAMREGYGLGLRGVHRRGSLLVGTPSQGDAPSLASSELDDEAVRAFRGHEFAVGVSVRPGDDLEVLPV